MMSASSLLRAPQLLTLSFFSLSLLLGGCSKDAQVCDITPTDLGTLDVQTDTGSADAGVDTGWTDLGTPDPGAFGAPCNGNSDCDSGWCVESAGGYVCTKGCDTDCPAGWDCKSVSSGTVDIVFLCVPRIHKLCAPCISDGQC